MFSLHVTNKLPNKATFEITATPIPGAEFVIPSKRLELDSLADQRIPIFVRRPRDTHEPGQQLQLTVRTDSENNDIQPEERRIEAPLYGPRQLP